MSLIVEQTQDSDLEDTEKTLQASVRKKRSKSEKKSEKSAKSRKKSKKSAKSKEKSKKSGKSSRKSKEQVKSEKKEEKEEENEGNVEETTGKAPQMKVFEKAIVEREAQEKSIQNKIDAVEKAAEAKRLAKLAKEKAEDESKRVKEAKFGKDMGMSLFVKEAFLRPKGIQMEPVSTARRHTRRYCALLALFCFISFNYTRFYCPTNSYFSIKNNQLRSPDFIKYNTINECPNGDKSFQTFVLSICVFYIFFAYNKHWLTFYLVCMLVYFGYEMRWLKLELSRTYSWSNNLERMTYRAEMLLIMVQNILILPFFFSIWYVVRHVHHKQPKTYFLNAADEFRDVRKRLEALQSKESDFYYVKQEAQKKEQERIRQEQKHDEWMEQYYHRARERVDKRMKEAKERRDQERLEDKKERAELRAIYAEKKRKEEEEEERRMLDELPPE